MLTTEFSSGAGVRGGCAANWLVARVFAVGEAGSLGRFGEIRILVNIDIFAHHFLFFVRLVAENSGI